MLRLFRTFAAQLPFFPAKPFHSPYWGEAPCASAGCRGGASPCKSANPSSRGTKCHGVRDERPLQDLRRSRKPHWQSERPVGILGKWNAQHNTSSAELRDGTRPRVLALNPPGIAHASQKRGKSVSDGFSRASLCVFAVKPSWQCCGVAASQAAVNPPGIA